jgi:Na+:H+ antiporter, NhaA family
MSHGDPLPTRPGAALPTPPIQRLARPLVRFLQVEAASGGVLLACTILALVLANSPWAGAVADFWHTEAGVVLGGFELKETLGHWINDGLMTIFFFLVGLEIKRELVAGELREPRKAALPIVAAVGGMVVPAGVYLLLGATTAPRGWGVPMATDIAFVVGFLALLGRRVPPGLKVLLLSLAIVDDIGAVLVIAIFYSNNLSFLALGLGAAGFGLLFLLRRLGVRSVAVYVFLGAAIWLAFLKSGVHPTIAGVLLGLCTPSRPWVSVERLGAVMAGVRQRLDGGPGSAAVEHNETLGRLVLAAREAVSPLERLEELLHPWVAFVIMPLFALANAGVRIVPADIASPVALAVALGLLLGKPLGIWLFSVAAVRLGVARLPAGVDRKVLLGGGCLGGIGFTMALFIAHLALHDDLLESGKIGILAGSTVSAVVGCGLLVCLLRRRPPLVEGKPS